MALFLLGKGGEPLPTRQGASLVGPRSPVCAADRHSSGPAHLGSSQNANPIASRPGPSNAMNRSAVRLSAVCSAGSVDRSQASPIRPMVCCTKTTAKSVRCRRGRRITGGYVAFHMRKRIPTLWTNTRAGTPVISKPAVYRRGWLRKATAQVTLSAKTVPTARRAIQVAEGRVRSVIGARRSVRESSLLWVREGHLRYQSLELGPRWRSSRL